MSLSFDDGMGSRHGCQVRRNGSPNLDFLPTDRLVQSGVSITGLVFNCTRASLVRMVTATSTTGIPPYLLDFFDANF